MMALRRGVEENMAQMELASESTYTWYLPDATLKEMSPPRPRAHAGGAAGGSGHRGGRGASAMQTPLLPRGRTVRARRAEIHEASARELVIR